MSDGANPLATLIAGLQAAVDADDAAAAHRLLYADPKLWDCREGFAAEWERYAALLVRSAALFTGDDAWRSIRHAIHNLAWIERHPGPAARCRRLEQLLPAIDRFVARDERELLRFIDEVRGGGAPCEGILAWLDHIEAGGLHPHLRPDTVQAARLAYECSPKSGPAADDDGWDQVWPDLMARLLLPAGQVRAYAARLLGEWHLEKDREKPALRQTFDQITELDLARPGVAGPFLGAFYSADLDAFRQGTGVDPADWVLHLLEHRSGPEPSTLPCSNAIDFFAHELLTSEDQLIRLVRAGHVDIAAESAQDSGVDLAAPCCPAWGQPAEPSRKPPWSGSTTLPAHTSPAAARFGSQPGIRIAIQVPEMMVRVDQRDGA